MSYLWVYLLCRFVRSDFNLTTNEGKKDKFFMGTAFSYNPQYMGEKSAEYKWLVHQLGPMTNADCQLMIRYHLHSREHITKNPEQYCETSVPVTDACKMQNFVFLHTYML